DQRSTGRNLQLRWSAPLATLKVRSGLAKESAVMPGRAVIFINYKMVTLPGNPGHVSWGFEDSPGFFYFGGTEFNIDMAPPGIFTSPGSPNAVFIAHGTEQQMLCAMQSGFHEGAGFTYDDYKMLSIKNTNSRAGLDMAQQSFGWGYSGAGNNCMDHCFRIIKAYAGNNDTVLPWPIANWYPKDFFGAIKAPLSHLKKVSCQFPDGAGPLYRLRSKSQDDYFYTASADELNKLIKGQGFYYEGAVGWIFSAQAPGTVPLYRMYFPKVEHFYTCSAPERDNAIHKIGFHDEGIAGYVYPSPHPGSTPLLRLYNSAKKHHFYTTSGTESLVSVKTRGFHQEGITCHVIV